jgi:hypothetical protein
MQESNNICYKITPSSAVPSSLSLRGDPCSPPCCCLFLSHCCFRLHFFLLINLSKVLDLRSAPASSSPRHSTTSMHPSSESRERTSPLL